MAEKKQEVNDSTPAPSPKGGNIAAPDVPSIVPNSATNISQPQSANSIVTVDSVIVVNRVKPVYPQISRKRGEEGSVVLLARVLNGKVVNVTIEKSSGVKALDSSALAAVGKWSFSSGTSLTVRIPVSFKLKDQ
ncbi:MAG: energy transducer TonB [Synergistaceae bacterium]|nr:energy transducer TonB [Synergistaceae bacterium]